MKKIIHIIGIISCLFSINSFAAKQSLDQIVAVVNDDVVTRSELTSAMSAAKAQIAQEQIPSPSEKVLQKQVLDQLINKNLQLQIAKQTGINVTDHDVNRSISQVAKQNNISINELYDRLAQEGLSKSSYRNEMREQLIIHRVQQQEVVSRINVTPDEIKSFMKASLWKNNSHKEYHLEDLLIPISDSPAADELNAAKQRAIALTAQLKKGGDFQQVVADNKVSGLQGGDLGWRKFAEIPTAFADSIAHMKTNDIAGPIKTSNGFHIIHLAAIRNGNTNGDIGTTHKQAEQLIMQRKFEEAMQHWVSRIRGQSFIENKLTA